MNYIWLKFALKYFSHKIKLYTARTFIKGEITNAVIKSNSLNCTFTEPLSESEREFFKMKF